MADTPLLTGKQVYLKKLQSADISTVYVDWLNSPKINRYLESRHKTQTIESCKKFVSELEQQGSNYFWGVYCKKTDLHIGNIKLGPVTSTYHRAPIGLIIGDDNYWGKGIATEIIDLVTDFAFKQLHLHKVNAGCYSSNQGSKRAFIKAGFQIEGTLKDQFLVENNFEDCILLGKISEDTKEAN